MAEYSIFLRPDLLQRFWQVMADGGFITDAVGVINTSRRTGRRVLVEAGGVRPRRGRNLKGRCLTFAEREEIAPGRAAGQSVRFMAARLGRSPSTISRELRRNADGHGAYRASSAHVLAYERAARPKPAKLATNLVLRAKVETDLAARYSPEQIAGRLRKDFPDDREMSVSTETIYQSLYVQSRGALRRELTVCLRTGRAMRHGHLQSPRGIPGRVLPEAATTALGKVGLGDHRSTKLTALSGGMLRRAGIAQAIVNEPDLLILDEPTAGLDPEQRQGFYEVLGGLDSSTSVLLSTHLLEDVEALRARVVVLAGGTVRFEGSSTELAEVGGGPGLRPAYIKLVGSPPAQLPPA